MQLDPSQHWKGLQLRELVSAVWNESESPLTVTMMHGRGGHSVPHHCHSRPLHTSLNFRIVNAACQRCSLREEAQGTPALRRHSGHVARAAPMRANISMIMCRC